jgi:hypothetical protein
MNVIITLLKWLIIISPYMAFTQSWSSIPLPGEGLDTTYASNGWIIITAQDSDPPCVGCGSSMALLWDESATESFDPLLDSYVPPITDSLIMVFSNLPNYNFFSLPNFGGLSIQSLDTSYGGSIQIGVLAWRDSAMLTFHMSDLWTKMYFRDQLRGECFMVDSALQYDYINTQFGYHAEMDDRFLLSPRPCASTEIIEPDQDCEDIEYYDLLGRPTKSQPGLLIRVACGIAELIFI